MCEYFHEEHEEEEEEEEEEKKRFSRNGIISEYNMLINAINFLFVKDRQQEIKSTDPTGG